ncbi:MAG: porin [Vitreoscilla sp.]|nr:porin [Vitreoscilla sp.]
MKRPPLTACCTAIVALLATAYSQAQSNATVYGVIDVAVAQRQLAGQVAVRNVDSGLMETSHIGFRGSEDLGGGLRANVDLSSFIRPDTGEATRGIPGEAFWSRAAWVGLSGGWGSLRLGRISTQNFIHTMRFNPFGPAAGLNPTFLHTYIGSPAQPMTTGSGATDSAWNNSLAYGSPNLSGFTLSLQAAPSEGGTAGRRLGASVVYGAPGQPLSAGLSYDRSEHATLVFPMAIPTLPGAVPPFTGTDFATWQLGAAWDFGAAKLYGQVADTQIDGSRAGPPPLAKTIGLRTWQLGVSVPLGTGALLVSAARTERALNFSGLGAEDQTRTTVVVGYDHNLSKRTDLYAVAMSDRATRLDTGTTAAIGVRHRF